DRGAMGGELLLVALGGCFLSNLLAAIRAREAPIQEVRVVVEGTLAEAPPRYRQIRMEVQARTEDRALLEKLVAMAERACIVANTLRGGVDLEVRVV
ncbi:OsmC family protein, partial [Thermus scotoductus]